MQALVPMVFVLGLPPTGFAGALRNEAVLIGGGLAYIAIALTLTAIADAGGRRLMASEALREFSAYLRKRRRLLRPDDRPARGLWRGDPSASRSFRSDAIGARAFVGAAGSF